MNTLTAVGVGYTQKKDSNVFKTMRTNFSIAIEVYSVKSGKK